MERQLTAVLLPGKSHGWRRLAGYIPWGFKEWDMETFIHGTSRNSQVIPLSLTFLLLAIAVFNSQGIERPSLLYSKCIDGNTTHSSVLENPRDGGAWWAAVYGVAQSQI